MESTKDVHVLAAAINDPLPYLPEEQAYNKQASKKGLGFVAGWGKQTKAKQRNNTTKLTTTGN